MKKYIVLSAVIILITFLFVTEDVLPTRLEISDLEIIEIMGIDYIDNMPSITVVRNSLNANSTTGGGSSESNIQNVATIAANTFEEALELMQILSDKYVSLAHVEYILLGEDTLKKGLDEITNFLGHSNTVGINAYIYVTKGTTAADFISQVQSGKYTIKDKLNNMFFDELSKAISYQLDLDNLFEISLNDKRDGIIPAISILDKTSKELKIEDLDNSKYFSYNGAAVLNNMQLVSYIDEHEMFGYNIISNKINSYTINVDVNNQNIVVGLNNFEKEKKYIIEDNEIKQINLNINVIAKIMEFPEKGILVSNLKLKEYEEYISKYLEKIVKSGLEKSYNLGVDYYNIEKDIYMKHPYKYKKIEAIIGDDFFKIIKEAKLNINVNVVVETSYDMIKTNSLQEGLSEVK